MIVTSRTYNIMYMYTPRDFGKSVLALYFRLLTRMKGRSLLPRRLVSQQRVKRLLQRVVVVSLAASPPAANQERRKRGMFF